MCIRDRLYIEAIPIRPLRVMAIEALAKIKDVEVLRPYNAVSYTHLDVYKRQD